jgi:beta-glucosidase
MAMPWVDDVAAVLQAWYPGQEGGNAVADVLVGDVDPAGRMPTTWPKRLEDTPAFSWYPGDDGHAKYGEGLLLGYRWYLEHEIQPQWWFGQGLSYTTFEWGEASGDHRQVSVEVTNTGERTGTDVVQVYVDRPDGPARALAGFAKVTLDPGAAAVVTVDLEPAVFRTWSDGWTVPGGPRSLRVGRSVADQVAELTVEVPGSE